MIDDNNAQILISDGVVVSSLEVLSLSVSSSVVAVITFEIIVVLFAVFDVYSDFSMSTTFKSSK